MILISLVPVHFGPCRVPDGTAASECVVKTDRSPVAAGGIIAFHPFSIAVRLEENDRLCDSLILLIQESFPEIFISESPAVSRNGLRRFPCILLSGLSWAYRTVHPENPGSQRAGGSIS